MAHNEGREAGASGGGQMSKRRRGCEWKHGAKTWNGSSRRKRPQGLTFAEMLDKFETKQLTVNVPYYLCFGGADLGLIESDTEDVK